MTDYVPHDKNHIDQMLEKAGYSSIEELFSDIPEKIKLKRPLNLPESLSEPDLLKKIKEIAEKNKCYASSFRGAGSYYHYIPSLVDFVLSRSEFYTAYTPYQPELSQGFLQAIYEYQSMISRLTGMDITNASMYDGATALAEAAITAMFHTRKNKVLIFNDIHPNYIEVVKTYCWGRNLDIEIIEPNQLSEKINDQIGAVLFQSPNFFGDILDVDEITSIIRNNTKKCLIIQSVLDPTCLGILKPPSEYDIDIFTAEGQSFGSPPSFGGPNLGIFTAKKTLMRKIPGRLVGITQEKSGDKIGYVLTLQTREQHIRREKASSNICSNQGLVMLAALVYLSSLGKQGIKEIAEQNIKKSYFLKQKLNALEKYKVLNKRATYNEFVLECPDSKALIHALEKENILPPIELSNYYENRENQLLVCVTEKNSAEEIKKFITIAKEVGN